MWDLGCCPGEPLKYRVPCYSYRGHSSPDVLGVTSEVPAALVHSQDHLFTVPQSPQGSFSFPDCPLHLSIVFFLIFISATAFVLYALGFQFVFRTSTAHGMNHSLYSGQWKQPFPVQKGRLFRDSAASDVWELAVQFSRMANTGFCYQGSCVCLHPGTLLYWSPKPKTSVRMRVFKKGFFTQRQLWKRNRPESG